MSVTTYPAVIRNGKVEAKTALELPEGSEVYVVAPSTMTAALAKRRANGWLISEVGNLLLADDGMLVAANEHWVWRFAVYMTAPTHEPWGPIGTVDISAASGAIVAPEQTKMQLYAHGRTYQRPV